MYNIRITLKRGTLLKATLVLQVLLFSLKAQNNLILNGSFENNLCNVSGGGNANLSNSSYNALMLNSSGFGTSENIDILKINSGYCGAAQDGIWYLGLTSGGTDAFSLKLSSSLIQNHIYSLTFYSRVYANVIPGCPVKVGASNSDTMFGNLIYTNTVSPDTCQWMQSVFSFTAPINAQYITITCGGANNTTSAWINIDNFVLDTGSYTGISKMDISPNLLNIYPNPSNGNMAVEYKITNDAVMQIIDLNGNLVETYCLLATGNRIEVKNQNLQNGVYLYRIISNNAVIKFGKVVIMK